MGIKFTEKEKELILDEFDSRVFGKRRRDYGKIKAVLLFLVGFVIIYLGICFL